MKGKRWITVGVIAALCAGIIPVTAADIPVHFLLNCPRAVLDGVITQIDEKNADVMPFLASDITMAPIRFLTESLDYQVTYDVDTQTAVLTGEHRIMFQNGSTEFMLDGAEYSMPRAAEEWQNRLFVPVRAVCEALSCTVLWNNELVSIFPSGTQGVLPAADAQMLIQQLRDGKVVPKDAFSIIGERIIQDVYSTAADPTAALQDIQEDGSFTSIDYQDTNASVWEPSNHMDNILTMVKAAYSPDNSFYNDEQLKEKIALALTYWAVNDFTNPNNTWFTTHGIPTKLADILLFPIEGLTVETRQKLDEIVKRGYLVVDDPENPYVERRVGSQGGNLTDLIVNSLKIAVATQDKEFVATLVDVLNNELRVFPEQEEHELWQENEGIKADYSFWQHNRLPCFGSYGEVFVKGVNKLLRYLNGTEYMVSNTAVEQYTNLIIDGLQWAVVGPYVDYTVNGRSIARQNGTRALQPGLKEACEVLLSLDHTPRREEVQTLYDTRFVGEDKGITGHKHFWKSDYTVHKGKGYHIGIRATSDRTRPMDRINGENALGYYLGDGATVLMRTGEEFLNIFPTWDWNKIPGTTTAQNTLPMSDDEDAIFHWFGKTPFAGGVSDGVNGATTLDYDRDGVKAYKSWFMVDNTMFALGSGITSDNSNDIVTTVNQTLQKEDYSMNEGASVKNETAEGLTWIEQDNIGYIFPEGGNVMVSAKEQSGSWHDISVISGKEEVVKNQVFTVAVNHGIRPQDATYSYLVAMDADAAETQQIAEEFPFEILQNDTAIQAVCHKEKKIVQAVFREAGTLCVDDQLNISVGQPCILMYNAQDAKVTAANPYNKQETVHVVVNGQEIDVALPGGEYAGQSITSILK